MISTVGQALRQCELIRNGNQLRQEQSNGEHYRTRENWRAADNLKRLQNLGAILFECSRFSVEVELRNITATTEMARLNKVSDRKKYNIYHKYKL